MQSEALSFLEALDRLLGRLTGDEAPNNRYILGILDLVELEHERARAAPEPPWPDTLWTDHRLSLVLVQRQLAAVFDRYPEPPPDEVWRRALEVTQWLVLLMGDVRRAVSGPQVH